MPLIAHITLSKARLIFTFLKSKPSAVLGQEAFPRFLPSIKEVLSSAADGDGSLISPKLERIQKYCLNIPSLQLKNIGSM